MKFELYFGCNVRFCSIRSLSDADYNKVADETLESLTELLEELSDLPTTGSEFDVSYSVKHCLYIYILFLII